MFCDNNVENQELLGKKDKGQCLDGKNKPIWYSKKEIKSISFELCQMPEINDSVMAEMTEAYTGFTEFNMTGIELESFKFDGLHLAKHLIRFLARTNKLKKFPDISPTELLLSLQDKLLNVAFVDVSWNQIVEINPTGFNAMPKLEHLDLSFNKIDKLPDAAFKSLLNMKLLNLSNNAIADVPADLFADSCKLTSIDFSFNNISELAVSAFVRVHNLNILNLSRNKLTDIPIGVFSFQIKLRELDLSGNLLKILDFDLFLPSMPYLNVLLLAQNNLTTIDGFTNMLFPKLKRISLAQNKFNCDYLGKFMRSINWDDLGVDDPDSNLVPLDNEMNIRGIRCFNRTSVSDEIFNDDDLRKLIKMGLLTFQGIMLLFILGFVAAITWKI